jgi:hypothetical protein
LLHNKEGFLLIYCPLCATLFLPLLASFLNSPIGGLY